MGSIGVIGLGNIGSAIATNVVADGHITTVSDLDPHRAAAVDGATAGSVEDVARASDITITSLPTPDVVAAVAATWSSAAAPGSVLLDLSTSAPSASERLAATLADTGHHLVESPLTGGAVGAESRTLVFMVGGDPEPVERCRPLLAQLGRATFHLGPVGTGTTMKLVNSLLAFTCTWASLEGLALAAAAGIDLRTAVDVVRTGGASNFFIDRAVEGIDTRGRPVQFALSLAAKDARLIDEAAAEHGIEAPVAATIRRVLADAVAQGLGDHDWSELVAAAEASTGVDLTLGPPR